MPMRSVSDVRQQDVDGCCLAGGVVAYRSRTQSICAQSSTEAELIAANAAAKVTKYLRFVLHELGYTQNGAHSDL